MYPLVSQRRSAPCVATTGERRKRMAVAPFRSPRKFLAFAVISLSLAACASIERQEAEQTEQLLSAAGFSLKLADSPEKLAQLRAMKQRVLLPRTKDGQTYFLYADADGCNCLYAGNEADHQAYERLAVQQEIAIANREAALDADEAAEMDWGAWGYPGW
ncbi:MAG: hypothetical protein HC834_01795 [Rhodospirillales bacterium]|nr:hypothetical protein [Rhodospirillales bacterium]